MKLLGLFVVALAPAGAAHAQDEGRTTAEAFLDAFAPGAEHARLAGLAGEWGVEGRLRFGPDEPWTPFAAVSSFELILDGHFLRERIHAEKNAAWPRAYEAERLFGFDPAQQQWRLVVMHNLGAAMTVAEGAKSDDPSFISLRSASRWPAEEGGMVSMAWRTEYWFLGRDRVVHRERIRHGAGDEYVGIEATYVRRRGGHRLLGAWEGVDDRGNKMVFSFDRNGSVVWDVISPDGEGSWRLRYQFDDASSPALLDLHGMDSGPLAGRSLFGIVEFDGPDAFRLDLEPGAAGATGDAVRPGKLDPAETVLFRRR